MRGSLVRHGLPSSQGRGTDRLPPSLRASLLATLTGSLDGAVLRAAFARLTAALLTEATAVDPYLAGRLDGPLRALAGGDHLPSADHI